MELNNATCESSILANVHTGKRCQPEELPTCPTCGWELRTKQGIPQTTRKFTAKRCPTGSARAPGSTFYDPEAGLKFCDDCNSEGGDNNRKWKNAIETPDRDHCGEALEYYQSDTKGVYCPTWVEDSEEFLGEAQGVYAETVTIACKRCGETIEALRSDLLRDERAFCGLDCYGEWLSKHKVGEDHPQWKGGIYPTGRSGGQYAGRTESATTTAVNDAGSQRGRSIESPSSSHRTGPEFRTS